MKEKFAFNAFTLFEMIVALVLMAILFMIGMMAYTMINGYFRDFQAKASFLTSRASFESVLEQDIFSNQQMAFFYDTLTDRPEIVMTDEQHRQLLYIFDTLYAIRQTNISTDTFDLKAIPRVDKTVADSIALVTDLRVKILFRNQTFLKEYTKQYSTEQILNYISLHEQNN